VLCFVNRTSIGDSIDATSDANPEERGILILGFIFDLELV